MRRLRENQLIHYQARGKTLRVRGYELKWNKPEAEGTIESPRMPVCCMDVELNGGEFEVYEDIGIVAVAMEENAHAALEKFHNRKPIPNG